MSVDPREVRTPSKLESGTRIAAVVSTYHGELTAAMRDSAQRELFAAGLAPEDWLVLEAPGAFELPVIARRMIARDDIDAVLCFGVVLKGETRHDEFIAGAVAQALQQLALSSGRPILFGVLTCDTLEQARARALAPEQGGKQDKGREVARAAVETLAALDRAARLGVRSSAVGFGAQRPSEERR